MPATIRVRLYHAQCVPANTMRSPEILKYFKTINPKTIKGHVQHFLVAGEASPSVKKMSSNIAGLWRLEIFQYLC